MSSCVSLRAVELDFYGFAVLCFLLAGPVLSEPVASALAVVKVFPTEQLG